MNVLQVNNGDTDIKDISEKIELANKSDKPTIIRVKTTIGYGSNKAGKSASHGAPLGEEEVERLRNKYFTCKDIDNIDNIDFKIIEQTQELLSSQSLNTDVVEKIRNLWFPSTEPFSIKPSVLEKTKLKIEDGKKLEDNWINKSSFNNSLSNFISNIDLTNFFNSYDINSKGVATRVLSGNCLQKISENYKNFIIGSADLTPSVNTL